MSTCKLGAQIGIISPILERLTGRCAAGKSMCLGNILSTVLHVTNEPPTDLERELLRQERDALVPQLAGAQKDLGFMTDHLAELYTRYRECMGQLILTNAALSALRKFSDELLARIFAHFCRDSARRQVTTVRSGPLLIGHVCSRWRDLSKGLPELWDTVRLDVMQPLHRLRSEYLATLLFLSKGRNLRVDLRGPFWSRLQGVWDHAHRISELSLLLPSTVYRCSLFAPDTCFGTLKIAHLSTAAGHHSSVDPAAFQWLQHAPGLRHFTLRLLHWVRLDDFDLYPIPWKQLTKLHLILSLPPATVHRILAACVGLEDCHFASVRRYSSSEGVFTSGDALAVKVPVLHRLRSLHIDLHCGDEEDTLAPLNCPNLVSLETTWYKSSAEAFLFFASRSSFKLQSLSLDTGYFDPSSLNSFLRQQVSLESLILSFGYIHNCARLSAVLRGDAAISLPHLHTFAITMGLMNGEAGPLLELLSYVEGQTRKRDGSFPVLTSLQLTLLGDSPFFIPWDEAVPGLLGGFVHLCDNRRLHPEDFY
ncbi:hypothetical protein C8R43DRAFT_942798 [Mycena crocata]|nr:hypothetical protein C8R43DRAFT_942798 [Mycena crocata]